MGEHVGRQVACVSAVVKELVSLTGKRRGGPRPALVVDAAKVLKHRADHRSVSIFWW